MKADETDGLEYLRESVVSAYQHHPTGCGGSFGEILCYELHTQPINPRMRDRTISGNCTGLTFKELAAKWGISTTLLGELVADHFRRL